MKKSLLVPAFLIYLLPASLLAQFTYRLDSSIPVLINSDTLRLAWAGGFNAGQFNTIDLNMDGVDDLAIFDRMAGRIMTFLKTGNRYVYAPQYEVHFPEDITNWVLLRDFNCDGKKDLFTGDVLGIKVYKNSSAPGQPPAWEHFLFDTGFGTKSTVLLTKGFTNKVNLQLNFDDLPAISDADGDGDLDIFNVKFVGAGTIEFHKNFSMERYGTCDSLDFERITQTWGGVTECSCGEFAFNNESCSSGGRQQHAGGKSLVARDLDNDGDQDLLFSESDCFRIYQLLNEGSNAAPLVTAATAFPVSNPIAAFPYPTVYFEDADGDGVTDMLATPNIFYRESTFTNLKECIWFYKNTGTNQLPQFSFQSPNYLQANMIDVGDNAVPAFFDADGDGDFDLFIGNYAHDDRAAVAFYENTGSRNEPAFNLVTENYAGISFLTLTNIKPTFADMNGDTRPDLVFTASNQFGFSTNLYFIPNTANIGLQIDAANIQSLNFTIFANENVSVVYVNNDSKPDLLVGKSNGALQYWENTGTLASPAFTLINPAFLGLGSSVIRQNLSCSAADLDNDGNMDLVIGDQTGQLGIVSNFKEASTAEPIRNIVYNELSEQYQAQNLGGRTWPVAVNLFNTDKPAIVVGNITGGIHILKHDETSALPDAPQIEIYPNPVITDLSPVINIRVDRPAQVYVINTTGQQVGTPLYLNAYQSYQFETGGLKAGLYIFRFIIRGKSYARRVIIH
ncbi:MAG: T9SS type A sorting domain-containing protein [Flammeovirgaceae bacterium]|nr:MAG: T9SS type A sorting domain-containing protein [Flammeovirgaceae bacterium]